MILIAHRGNMNGPNEYENGQKYCEEAIAQGFNIELDVNNKPEVSIKDYTQTTFEIDSLKLGEFVTFRVKAVGLIEGKESKFTELGPKEVTNSLTNTPPDLE